MNLQPASFGSFWIGNILGKEEGTAFWVVMVEERRLVLELCTPSSYLGAYRTDKTLKERAYIGVVVWDHRHSFSSCA